MEVIIDGQITKLRKQRLCWLAQSDSIKISSDISKRFIPKKCIMIREIEVNNTAFLWKSETISRGELVLFSENKQLFYGNVLNFQNSKETSKVKRRYLKDFITLEPSSQKSKNISMLLDPLFVLNNFIKKEIIDKHKYIHQNNYVCHVLNDTVNFNTAACKRLLKNFIVNQD